MSVERQLMLFLKQPTSITEVGLLHMLKAYSASSFRIALKSARVRSGCKSGSVFRRFNIAGSLKTPASIARRINKTAFLADSLLSGVKAEIKAAVNVFKSVWTDTLKIVG